MYIMYTCIMYIYISNVTCQAGLSVGGRVMARQLGCVQVMIMRVMMIVIMMMMPRLQCAGVVLSASFLCLESEAGLSRACVEAVMGAGECNVCIQEFLSLQ